MTDEEGFHFPTRALLRALRAIENAAASSIEAPNAPTLEGLAAENRALRKEVARIAAMISVLGEALGRAKAIDMTWTAARLEEELERIDPKPRDPQTTHAANTAYRGNVGGDPTATSRTNIVRCEGCKQPVESGKTNVTDEGVLCDRCFLARSGV